MQESFKTPKTLGKNHSIKAVCKSRDVTPDKENRLFKTKTLANLNNFSKTAKNLKSDKKYLAKTQTNTNKSTILHSEKENLTTIDTFSKNKTFVIDKSEPTIKREKTKTNLLNNDESSSFN